MKMWTRLSNWLTGEEHLVEGATRRAAATRVISQLTLILLPVYVASSYLISPQPVLIYALVGLLWTAAVAALVVSRRGGDRLPALFVVLAMWLVVAILVWEMGVFSYHWGAFSPVIVATGILMSARFTMAITLASCAAFLATYFRDAASIVVQSDTAVPSNTAAPLDIAFSPDIAAAPDIAAPLIQIFSTGVFVSGLMFAFGRVLVQLKDKQGQLEASQQNLRRAEKMEAFGQLAGGVAHDFNNILTGMLGHIDLIRLQLEEAGGDEALKQDLDELERAADRGAAITRQLLAFSRQRSTDHGSSDVTRIVLDAEGMLRRLVREDIRIHMEVEESGAAPLASSSVEQLLMNLILNAADAMPQGGAMSVKTWNEELLEPREVASGRLEAGRYAALAVADSGHGIDQQVLPRIFEPFFTTKPTGQGTGLGLATVHGIVQRAGGQIDVCSVPGRGTEFTIYLPSTQSTQAPSVRRRSLPIPVVGEVHLLVCEDDEIILQVMAKALREHGYVVHATDDAREALEIGRSLGDRLDLLVTDVIMPEMNGRQLSEELSKSVSGLRVLYVSGYTAGLLQDSGMADDDERLLSKPFTPLELLKRVELALDRDGAADARAGE